MDLSFQQFESQLRALGFDTVLEQKWGPSAVADTHSHPFEARSEERRVGKECRP